MEKSKASSTENGRKEAAIERDYHLADSLRTTR